MSNKTTDTKQLEQKVDNLSGMEYNYQIFRGLRYSVCDLIEASKNIKVEEVPIKYLQASTYKSPCQDDLVDFAWHVKRVNDADLNYPIILSPDGVILDGSHRLAKAIIQGEKSIKCVQFDVIPNIGFNTVDK